MARPIIGNLWVAKDEDNNTYMRGYLFISTKGRKRVYLAKVTMNKNKATPTQPDFIVHDYTVGEPKIMKATKRRPI